MDSKYNVVPGDENEIHRNIASKCKLGIVEIGVLNGDSSKVLASATKIPVYGIDPIVPHVGMPNYIGNVDKIKENLKNCSNYIFIKDYSYNVVKTWNKPFDYIFIDGNHDYEAVKKDFEDWFPLLSKEGHISFHDSAMYRGGANWWSGPSKLADEIILNDKRLEYVTSVFSLTVFKKL